MRDKRRDGEAGIALVLALLSLMLLTFLGLALATSTSTELQISNNYRWSQQARYNAEAGIEVGKKYLATIDWTTVLLTARTNSWNGTATPSAAADGSNPPAGRNYENWLCDTRGNGIGYGKLLATYADVVAVDSALTPTIPGPTTFDVRGSFTLWVRRPVVPVTSDNITGTAVLGEYKDFSVNSDELILTAEGVAPFSPAGLATLSGQKNRAIRTMEVRLSRNIANDVCGSRGGQVGGGSEGAGFGGCAAVTSGSVATALGNAGTMTENTGAQ
jgi:hypothetical protein